MRVSRRAFHSDYFRQQGLYHQVAAKLRSGTYVEFRKKPTVTISDPEALPGHTIVPQVRGRAQVKSPGL